MTSSPNFDFSRWLYARLVRLYPRDYRESYGPAMVQVFTDQCRAAVRQSGLRGLIVIWCRTFWDLGKTLLREHLASPGSAAGLLEAVPGRPLPWKGVLLVLLPCLVFFVGQIGQLAGQDRFYLLIRRAALFLILPVLIVWVLTHRFPIWGLVPLGMFYRIMMHASTSMEFYLMKLDGTIFQPLLVFEKTYYMEVRIGIVMFLIAVAVFLTAVISRRRGLSRDDRVWSGIFLLFLILGVLAGLYHYKDFIQAYQQAINPIYLPLILQGIVATSYSTLASDIEFLLLIFAGALLARRHGRLALLLPLGFIIPFVLVGRYDTTTETTGFLVWTSVAVFAYRILVTLVAPIWIVRSTSDGGQRRAGILGFSGAAGIILLAQIGLLVDFLLQYGNLGGYDILSLYSGFSQDLIMFVGIALAISLYQRKPAESQTGSGNPARAIPA